jgi:glycosyltransferase involved in cell wall biosynthesis
MVKSQQSVPRFGLVSHILPPSRSGQAMVLYRLLSGLPPDSYFLISQQDADGDAAHDQYTNPLEGRHYRLRPGWQLRRGYFRIGRVAVGPTLNALLSLLDIVWFSRQIARYIRLESCEAFVACSANLANLPAAYLASRRCGVRFYAYYFDDYLNQWSNSAARYIASRFEPLMAAYASGVFVPNEFLYRDIQRRHGVKATIIHNPVDLAQYDLANADTPPDSGCIQDVVYTGSIYHAQLDAFENLLAAIDLLEGPNTGLHLYSSTASEWLEKQGIRGQIVHHGPVPLSATPAIQQQADVLFLPLAFNSPYPEVIRTAAPGKMGEYLASGRPILVHAPPDSFVAWYFKTYHCGLVVDRPSPEALAEALRRLRDEPETRELVTANARQRAKQDFDLAINRRLFSTRLAS